MLRLLLLYRLPPQSRVFLGGHWLSAGIGFVLNGARGGAWNKIGLKGTTRTTSAGMCVWEKGGGYRG